MITVPDRMQQLIERVEAGETISPADVRQLTLLQALDVAALGRQYAEQAVAADAAQSEILGNGERSGE